MLVCADAAALPIRDRAISGVWSVQAFQHFPQKVFHKALSELRRVLRDEFVAEIYYLNPAWLHKVIYRLFGKRLHWRGKLGAMEWNLLSEKEWINVWGQFRGGRPEISSGYSELFFHPKFHLGPLAYPLRLERALATYAPKLAGLFARQMHIRMETRAED